MAFVRRTVMCAKRASSIDRRGTKSRSERTLATSAFTRFLRDKKIRCMWAPRDEDVWSHSDAVVKETEKFFARPSYFAGAVLDAEGCDAINEGRPEIAFCGRSNVGKSTLINAIVGRNHRLNVSSKPGQTRGVNYIGVGGSKKDAQSYFVDLPGYGFARGSKKDRKVIEDRAIGYALARDQRICKKMFVLIDARRGIMPVDRDVLRQYDRVGVNSTIVLTKIDALDSETKFRHLLEAVGAELDAFVGLDPYVHFVGAHHGLGIGDLRRSIVRAIHLNNI